MSAWVLPDNFADVLPRSARHVEILRRSLLDTARGYGCELVIPPLLEHLDSLLLGTGESLDLLTFKLVDQMSGRTLGLRADTTIQAARVDAHLLNRQGVTRLCYCGPVAHTRPASAGASRELLQFGAEIYGHAGLEADLEVLRLARDCLAATHIPGVSVDLGHACIARSLLGGVLADHDCLLRVHAALAAKDASELAQITRDFPEAVRQGLQTLIRLYGDASVLDEARQHLPPSRQLGEALDQLAWLAQRLDGLRLTFDLADVRGYSYYSGMRFAVYAPGAVEALLRGGRYDEIGAAFGRNRPAVGFSLDVHELACCAQRQTSQSAIRAPWVEDAALREAVMALRNRGEVVIALPQGQRCETEEFSVDRELVLRDGCWQVQALKPLCA